MVNAVAIMCISTSSTHQAEQLYDIYASL